MKNLMLIMIMAMMALCVKAQPANNDDVKNPHEWVDLGLPSGTLWATMNVKTVVITLPGARLLPRMPMTGAPISGATEVKTR